VQINKQPYFTGLLKDDFQFYSKIEELYIKKMIIDQRDTKKEREALAKRLRENKSVDIPETLLGKRGLSLDDRKYQTEKVMNNFMLSAPEIKLKYRVEFAKDYLNRTPIDDHSVEPDILRIKVNDVDSVITCTEIDSMMKVLIVGSRSGSIQAFYFAEEHMTTEDGDPSKLLKVETPEEVENKPVEDNLKIVLEARPSDFEAEIRTMTFIGHSSSVTSLSVNYDATYFLSASVD
jgi:hypothetical protein